MQQFPTSAHLASWAAICPGNHESAGKRLSGKRAKAIPGYDAFSYEYLEFLLFKLLYREGILAVSLTGPLNWLAEPVEKLNVVNFVGGPKSSLETNTLGKQRKKREISITFFSLCHPTVFSLRLASDAASQVSEARNRIVVTDRKIDERASFLTSSFFPAKNY